MLTHLPASGHGCIHQAPGTSPLRGPDKGPAGGSWVTSQVSDRSSAVQRARELRLLAVASGKRDGKSPESGDGC
jgi:hypothetical protein